MASTKIETVTGTADKLKVALGAVLVLAAVAAAKQSGEKQLAEVLKSLQNNPRATAEQIESATKASSLFSQGIADVLALPAKVATLNAEYETVFEKVLEMES